MIVSCPCLCDHSSYRSSEPPAPPGVEEISFDKARDVVVSGRGRGCSQDVAGCMVSHSFLGKAEIFKITAESKKLRLLCANISERQLPTLCGRRSYAPE